MGFEVRPAAALAALAALLFGLFVLLAWLLPLPGFAATKLLLALAAVGIAAQIWHKIGQGHREVARFLAAIERGDLTQSFRATGPGPGLQELGAAFDRALARLRDERREAAVANRFAAALVDEVPTPLLVIEGGGGVRLANKAARSLFHEADGRAVVAFARYGQDLAQLLATAPPGSRRVCRVLWRGLFQRAIVQVVTLDRQGQTVRIASINLIQSELEAAEIATQTDLVRVLTHEIMNSLTPVVSLAESASHLLAGAGPGDGEALLEARGAVDALARRAAGIAGFVQSYREFSQNPHLNRAAFALAPWAEELVRTFSAMPQAAAVTLDVAVSPAAGRIDADAQLLGQVVLNLLKNAAEAAEAAADAEPRVALAIERNDAGRTTITIEDNGAGVPEGLEEEIFLPFFTTKSGGTGVGLSFAKQVVALHGGYLGVAKAASGGATFSIVL